MTKENLRQHIIFRNVRSTIILEALSIIFRSGEIGKCDYGVLETKPILGLKESNRPRVGITLEHWIMMARDIRSLQRNDLNDLCARGEEPICALTRTGSRIRPPRRIFGVWAQKAQM
jgi:hypothetical protein